MLDSVLWDESSFSSHHVVCSHQMIGRNSPVWTKFQTLLDYFALLATSFEEDEEADSFLRAFIAPPSNTAFGYDSYSRLNEVRS